MLEQRNKVIDDIIIFLNQLKGETNVELNIIPAHIEEIYSTVNGEMYGQCSCSIDITWNGLYKRMSQFDDWRKQ